VETSEDAENVPCILPFDANTVISHEEKPIVIPSIGTYVNYGLHSAAVFDCVTEKVLKQLLQMKLDNLYPGQFGTGDGGPALLDRCRQI